MLTTALLVALSAPAAALQLTAFTSGADFLTHACRCRVGLTAVDRNISLPKNVDKKTLKRRFKELAIELHPDVSGGDADAAAKFAQLSAEYHRRLSESRRGAQASAVGGVSAMTVFVASALYGTTQDPFMPIVLLGAAASLGSVFVNASGKGSGPPKQLAAEKRMLRHGTRYLALGLPARHQSPHSHIVSSPPINPCPSNALAAGPPHRRPHMSSPPARPPARVRRYGSGQGHQNRSHRRGCRRDGPLPVCSCPERRSRCRHRGEETQGGQMMPGSIGDKAREIGI